MTTALIFLCTYNMVTVQELWRAFFAEAQEKLVDIYLDNLKVPKKLRKGVRDDLVRSMQRGRFRFFFMDPDEEEPEFLPVLEARAGQSDGDLIPGEITSFVRICIAYDFPVDKNRPTKIVGDVKSLPIEWIPDIKLRQKAERLMT